MGLGGVWVGVMIVYVWGVIVGATLIVTGDAAGPRPNVSSGAPCGGWVGLG